MSDDSLSEITQLLQALDDESRRQEVWQRLLVLVYDELRRLAHGQRVRFQDAAPRHLETTELVHEFYARIEGHLERGGDLPDHSEHFFALAARAMRQLIIDTLRREGRQSRGGEQTLVAYEEDRGPLDLSWLEPEKIEQYLSIHQTLERLEEAHPAHVRLTELHVFLGLTLEEIATLQKVSLSTIKRRWRLARAWLASSLA